MSHGLPHWMSICRAEVPGNSAALTGFSTLGNTASSWRVGTVPSHARQGRAGGRPPRPCAGQVDVLW